MTKKEIAELVKICDCPEMQKLWKQKYGDEICCRDDKSIKIIIFPSKYNSAYIWLPRIEDCIRLMGNNFNPVYEGSYSFDGGVCWNNSARIACLSALKSVLKEDTNGT